MSENTPTPTKGRSRSWLLVTAVLASTAIVGAFATKAISHGSGDGYGQRGHGSYDGRGSHDGRGYGRGHKGGSWHGKRGHKGGRHGGGFGNIMGLLSHGDDPEKIEKRATRMVKYMAIELEATSEQTDKLVAIVSSLVKDVTPMRSDFKATRKAAVDMILNDNLDRAAIETLRADQIKRWDDTSKRVLEAMADASAVLTPEQRAKVRKHVENRRDRWAGMRGHKRQGGDRWKKRGGSRDGGNGKPDDTTENSSDDTTDDADGNSDE